MHKLYELCVPTGQEVFLYLFSSLFLLLAVNATRLWSVLLNQAGTDLDVAQGFSEYFKESVARYTTLSDPQLINAVIWGMTAFLGLLVALALAGFIRNEREDLTEFSRHDFLERLIIRVASATALFVLIILTVGVVLPATSIALVNGLNQPFAQWYTIPLLLGSIVAMALCMYLVAVVCRLLLLRVRVFSNVID